MNSDFGSTSVGGDVEESSKMKGVKKPGPKTGPLGGGYCFRSKRLMLVRFTSLTDVGQGVVLRGDVAVVESAA